METARHPNFIKLADSLPKAVQSKAKETFKSWKEDASSVKGHIIKGCDRSVFAIEFKVDSTAYRAIGVKSKNKDNVERCLWIWIGSHEDYNNYIPAQRNRLKSPETEFFKNVKVEDMLRKMDERLESQKNNLSNDDNRKVKNKEKFNVRPR